MILLGILAGLAAPVAEAPKAVLTPRLTEPVPWLSYYPGEARRAGIDGRVVVDCTVGEDGRLEDCVVFSETPKDYSFGDRAVGALKKHGRVDVTIVKPGQKVRQLVIWKMED